MACKHFPDDQTLRLQTGAGEDNIIHLPSGLDRVDCERQEEEEVLESQDTEKDALINSVNTAVTETANNILGKYQPAK